MLEKKDSFYKELSKSIINETVCRGRRKQTTLKESGINWIGKIPNHWQIKRLKDIGYLYNGLSGKNGEHFNQEVSTNSKYYIPFTNILNNKYINKQELLPVVMDENENQNRVKKNDLFFLMSSEGYEDVGKAALLIEDAGETYLNSFCKGFRVTKNSVVPRYLNYLLKSSSFRDRLIAEGKGFTRINLKMEKVSDFQFIIPKLEEQLEIVEYLDEKTQIIDNLRTNLNEQVSRLKELRISIIDEVVTGKIIVT